MTAPPCERPPRQQSRGVHTLRNTGWNIVICADTMLTSLVSRYVQKPKIGNAPTELGQLTNLLTLCGFYKFNLTSVRSDLRGTSPRLRDLRGNDLSGTISGICCQKISEKKCFSILDLNLEPFAKTLSGVSPPWAGPWLNKEGEPTRCRVQLYFYQVMCHTLILTLTL